MGFDNGKIIRTIRLVLTCFLLFLITWYYEIPEKIWSLITVWFVMSEYSSVGGVLKKGLFRFLGTFLSAVYSMIIVYAFSNNVVMNIIAFAIGVFIYAYYFMDGDKMYIATIGSVTLTIALLNINQLDVAILRTFNIIIGIIGSIFMIRFFYPQYARDEIIEIEKNFIKKLSSILDSYLDQSKSLDCVKADFLKAELNIIPGLTSFNRHLGEAKIETRKIPDYEIHHLKAIEHIRHLFRIIGVFVNYLTTDETRLTPWIHDEINQLLMHLCNIQNTLEGTQQGITPIILNRQTNPDEALNSIRLIINHMNNEMNNLNTSIKEIMIRYEVYHPKKNTFTGYEHGKQHQS